MRENLRPEVASSQESLPSMPNQSYQGASQVKFFLVHFLLRVLSLWRSKFIHFLMALRPVSTEFSIRKLLISKTNFLIPAFIPTVIQVPKLAYLTGFNSIISWGLGFDLVFIFCLFLTFGDFPHFLTKSAVQLKLCLFHFIQLFRISYLSFLQRQEFFYWLIFCRS